MFLTNLDSRAVVKGSRDPLGLVPVWSQFGRDVVGNLTTVTGSVRGFTTTLLGYHFAREVQDRDGGNAESALALFLKFVPMPVVDPIEVLSPAEFLRRTEPLYNHSLAANCRFFVVVYDSTGSMEKELYKHLLRTVEGHFYKRLDRGPAPF